MASNPFYFSGKITDPTRFIGRKDEIRFITQRMDGAQMTSVGVVGERRIGKSSLLHHIYQTYQHHVDTPQQFLVTELNLQDAAVRTRRGFVEAVSNQINRAILGHPQVDTLPDWTTPCADMIELGERLRALTEAEMRTIICLDEFEALLESAESRAQFDNNFYDALRAWMDDQHLMLVIASARPVQFYGGRYRIVSKFFNLGNTCNLGPFTEDEATVLLNTGGLGVRDKALAMELGKQHPFFLQMAAHYILEADQYGKDEEWIRTQFEQEQSTRKNWMLQLFTPISNILWTGPAWLGGLVGRVGAFLDDFGNRLVGFAFLALVVLILFGIVPLKPLLDWLLNQLGIPGGTP